MHYEQVNGNQDKADDEGEITAEQAERIGNSLRIYASESSMLNHILEPTRPVIPRDFTEMQPMDLYPLVGVNKIRNARRPLPYRRNSGRTKITVY